MRRCMAVGLFLLGIGCDGPTPPTVKYIDLQLDEDSLSVVPGTGTYPAASYHALGFRVIRKPFGGAIAMHATVDAPLIAGVDSRLEVPADTIASSLSVQVPLTTPPGVYRGRIEASAGDSGSVAREFVVIVLPFSMDMPGALRVNRGATNTLRVNLVRGGSASVTLAVAGAPAGVSVSSSSVPDGTQFLDFTAGATAAPGTTDVVVTASSGGGSQSRTVSLTVQDPPPKRAISFGNCFRGYPGYTTSYAYANDGESWTAIVPGSDGSFAFEATERLRFAFRFTYPGFYSTSSVARVIHVTATELETLRCAPSASGTQSFDVVVSNGGQPIEAIAWLGVFSWHFGRVSSAGTTGLFDLVASALRTNGGAVERRGIVRRDLNLPNGATIALDFASAESAILDSATYSLSGHGAATSSIRTFMHTPRTVAALHTNSGQGRYWALSPDVLRDDDIQSMSAMIADLGGGSTLVRRGVVRYFRDVTDLSLAFGPHAATAAANATLDSIVVPAQAEYPDLAGAGYSKTLDFRGAHATVESWQTRGYGAPVAGSWRIPVPEMGRLGYLYPLVEGQAIGSAAAAGPSLLMFGGRPVAGTELRYSVRPAGEFSGAHLPYPTR